MLDPLVIGYVCGGLRVTTDVNTRSPGPRAHVTGVVNGFRSRGCDVRTWLAGDRIAPRPGSVTVPSDRQPGTKTPAFATDAARLAMSPAFRIAARRAIGEADIVYERLASFMRLGSTGRSKPPVWIVESNGPFWHEASTERKSMSLTRTARRRELHTYQDADMVVVVSKALQHVLSAETGRPAADFLVVPNATTAGRFSVKPASRRERQLRIVFVGYLIEWAGVDTLIEAVSLAKSQGIDVQVEIVGAGPLAAELEALSQRRQLGESIRFLGLRPWSEIPEILARNHIGFSGAKVTSIGSMYHSPLKLYEYHAAGLAIMSSDFPDARTLVRSAGSGWLFESADVQAIVSAIVEADADRDELAQKGKRGRDLVRREHTWESRVVDIMAEVSRRPFGLESKIAQHIG
jgi:glycosyltransferase involved in cell wall biosynthesis